MFPEDIKQFVVDSNKEKSMLKELQDSARHRNQDITTRIGGPPGSTSYGSSNETATNHRAIVASTNKNLASMTTL